MNEFKTKFNEKNNEEIRLFSEAASIVKDASTLGAQKIELELVEQIFSSPKSCLHSFEELDSRIVFLSKLIKKQKTLNDNRSEEIKKEQEEAKQRKEQEEAKKRKEQEEAEQKNAQLKEAEQKKRARTDRRSISK